MTSITWACPLRLTVSVSIYRTRLNGISLHQVSETLVTPASTKGGYNVLWYTAEKSSSREVFRQSISNSCFAQIFHLNKSFREDILIRQEQELFIEFAWIAEWVQLTAFHFKTFRSIGSINCNAPKFSLSRFFSEVEFNSLEIAVIKSWNG